MPTSGNTTTVKSEPEILSFQTESLPHTAGIDGGETLQRCATMTAEEAAIAYDRAAYRMRGSLALLNFPLRINSGEPESVRITSKRRATSSASSLEDRLPKKRIKQEFGSLVVMGQHRRQVY
ncbi:hypothetical protein L1987_41611 [Smallanthus sonchifolius]|uniref:Uncharacterized protein n=1 Tax=Smallanthus sonchifolius TaxID=185202 RepID=A0ACB9GVZ5_9ASTR|nr:hypothetical protein L1987_41611 [Smallanthus sonchifolius]